MDADFFLIYLRFLRKSAANISFGLNLTRVELGSSKILRLCREDVSDFPLLFTLNCFNKQRVKRFLFHSLLPFTPDTKGNEQKTKNAFRSFAKKPIKLEN
jgi:hypothetical protein